MVKNVAVGNTYRDGDTEHEVVGISDGVVDVVEYNDGEEIGEYTVEMDAFSERMVE